MLKVIESIYHRYFSDEEAIILAFVLVGAMLAIWLFGGILAPVIAALIVAYVLAPAMDRMVRWRIPQVVAASLLSLLFLGLLLLVGLVLFPFMWTQLMTLTTELPKMIIEMQASLNLLVERFPEIFDEEQVMQWIQQLNLAALGNQAAAQLPRLVSYSLSTLPNIVTVLIYLLIVPLLVFFMLKDRTTLWQATLSMLPTRRRLLTDIGREMNMQIANYIRGKVIEILIVGAVTFITFEILGLNYSALLAVVVGLSVLIPYIGATVVTIPVALIALFQFGISSDFYIVLGAYLVIQVLDGNVLVPLLFSEAVNLHPVSIIVAVFFFGGIWGFWGVFFAIPLATLIKAVFNAWPKHPDLGETPWPSRTLESSQQQQPPAEDKR
ncbi:AI-2E family transporter [Natronospirillum operosum]|uniref:AI-2E family transporter n=1 Tax=Natronospirillum operosum TaxID=2759953 RepID=A0A4Z0WF44_9GAMM|nr:AI-2E family transporter [Natronospirillum operosum]TGG93916.1 AI-2E family transporter [Natronospirillum operosum]